MAAAILEKLEEAWQTVAGAVLGSCPTWSPSRPAARTKPWFQESRTSLTLREGHRRNGFCRNGTCSCKMPW